MCRENDSLEALMAGVNEELDKLQFLSKEQKEKKNADIKEMITYYLSMTQDMDARLTKWHDIALQILGVSVAALVVLLTQQAEFMGFCVGKILFVPLLLTLCLLAIAASIVSFLYSKQQSFNKYPFNVLDKPWNQWKWFYYGNPSLLEISSNAVVRTRSIKRSTMPFLQGAQTFFSRYREEDLDGELRSNIQQLYLHQVLNYYKHRWFLQLACVWRWTSYLVPLAAAVALARSLVFN